MTALIVIAIILGIIGIIGCIVPGLPGPPISWLGLLCVWFAHTAEPVSNTMLLVTLGVVTLVTVIDYILPAAMTRQLGGHKAASMGAVIGLFAGMFFTPVGMIGGSLIGAFLGEYLVENRGIWDSFKASIGAFIGFIITTGIKLITSGVLFYFIIKFSF